MGRGEDGFKQRKTCGTAALPVSSQQLHARPSGIANLQNYTQSKAQMGEERCFWCCAEWVWDPPCNSGNSLCLVAWATGGSIQQVISIAPGLGLSRVGRRSQLSSQLSRFGRSEMPWLPNRNLETQQLNLARQRFRSCLLSQTRNHMQQSKQTQNWTLIRPSIAPQRVSHPSTKFQLKHRTQMELHTLILTNPGILMLTWMATMSDRHEIRRPNRCCIPLP